MFYDTFCIQRICNSISAPTDTLCLLLPAKHAAKGSTEQQTNKQTYNTSSKTIHYNKQTHQHATRLFIDTHLTKINKEMEEIGFICSTDIKSWPLANLYNI